MPDTNASASPTLVPVKPAFAAGTHADMPAYRAMYQQLLFP